MISNKACFYDFNGGIGPSSRVDDFCIISGNVQIGNHCHLGPFGILSGKNGLIKIGNNVGISARASIYSGTENFFSNKSGNPTINSKERDVIYGSVIIEDFVIIGAGVTIMPNVTIQEGASIAAGSIITKNVPRGAIVGSTSKMTIFGYRDVNQILLAHKDA
jgi:galactoside O-acetyltransferase